MITKDNLKQVFFEVYPFSFKEYLDVERVPYDSLSLLGTESRAAVVRIWNEYIYWGGLPEVVNLFVKRNYLSSTLQKLSQTHRHCHPD